MEIRIQAIHFDASERLQQFIDKKVSKLERYCDNIKSAEVSLKVVKPETSENKDVSIKITVPNNEFFVNKVKDTFEEGIDDCVEVLIKQLIKYKEKARD